MVKWMDEFIKYLWNSNKISIDEVTTLKKFAAKIEKWKNEYAMAIDDGLYATAQVERLKQENEKLKEYIKDYGWCGYFGSLYSKAELKVNCPTCMDNDCCERYKILK